MRNINKIIYVILLLNGMMLLNACNPEVGSEKWCVQLKEKPKGEWTTKELANYSKYCIF